MSDVDPRDEVDTLRERLRGAGDDSVQVPHEPDRQHLLKMSDNIRLVPSEIGDHRHLKILRHTRRMATLAPWPTVADFRDNDEAADAGVENEDDIEALLEKNGLLGLALEYRAAAETIVRWINDEYANEHTNQDYRTALRSFGRYRLKLDEPPETLAWIPTGTSNDFNPVPSERDLLVWEPDVQPMVEGANNPRDKALLAVQLEAGCRSGELYDLRVGDVFDAEHSMGLHVDGKRGERAVHLIMSVPYLQRWLAEHPGGPDDPLWSKLSSPGRPSYSTWLDYFKNAAARAGVTKDVTPTDFRKANTRWLVVLGMSQPRIEDRQGRKRGSEHTRRYMARFGDESNEQQYALLHGKDVETDEPEEFGPVECPRCDRDTPREKPHCMWCSQALSFEAAEAAQQQSNALLEATANAEGDVANAFAALGKALNDSPELQAEVTDQLDDLGVAWLSGEG